MESRIALLQARQHPLDVSTNLARIERAAERAVAQSARLLLVPEMFLTGYDIGAEAAGRLAESSDGASATRLSEIARRLGIALCYGYPERAHDHVFNAAQFIDEHGRRLAHYRKTHLYGDLDRSMFSPGEAASAIVDWNGWRVGLLICYDIEFPEPVRRLADAGADLLLVPTANMIDFDVVPKTLVPARAFESQVVVAYANCCGVEGSLQYGGLSVVAAADGSVSAMAGRDEELLIATIDRDALTASRGHHTHLADRRHDLH